MGIDGKQLTLELLDDVMNYDERRYDDDGMDLTEALKRRQKKMELLAREGEVKVGQG